MRKAIAVALSATLLSGCAMNVKLPVEQLDPESSKSAAATEKVVPVGPVNYVRIAITQNFDRSDLWISNEYPTFTIHHDPWSSAGTIVETLTGFVVDLENSFKEQIKGDTSGEGFLDITSTVTYSDPSLITFDFDWTQNLPGDAHPDAQIETFAFNPQSGQRIFLVDELTPEGFRALGKIALRELKANYGDTGLLDDESMLRNALASKANWNNWKVDGDLEVTFPYYTMGSRPLQTPTIFLPYDEVVAALEDGPIKRAFTAD